jgi:hypothetical protein
MCDEFDISESWEIDRKKDDYREVVFLKEIGIMLHDKNVKYGYAFDFMIDKYGVNYFRSKIEEKWSRFTYMIEHGIDDTESKEDTLKDIIGYCALMLMYEEEVTKNIKIGRG